MMPASAIFMTRAKTSASEAPTLLPHFGIRPGIIWENVTGFRFKWPGPGRLTCRFSFLVFGFRYRHKEFLRLGVRY